MGLHEPLVEVCELVVPALADAAVRSRWLEETRTFIVCSFAENVTSMRVPPDATSGMSPIRAGTIRRAMLGWT